MEYFKKVGRPTDEEQALINVIEQLISDKQIPHSEIPQCLTLDDLLEVQNLLEAYVSDKAVNEESISTDEPLVDEQEEAREVNETEINEYHENEASKEIEEGASSEVASDSEPETETVEEVQIPESIEDSETEQKAIEEAQPNFVSNDYDPFSEEIKERSYTSQLNSEMAVKSDGLNLEESEQTPVDNLNPNTKRKVAEQSANAILKGYAKLAPKPFKWLAKIDEQKIEKLAFEGELNINIEVSEGTTFDDYMKQTNAQIDEIFEVDEDTLDEIREPLIEVLLEQKMELTPQQRLVMAVVSHLFQMFTIALNLRRQNNRILEYQKRMTLMTAEKAA